MELIYKDNISLKDIEEKDIEIIRLWRNEESEKKVFIDNKIITREAQLRWYNNYKNNDTDRMFIISINDKPIGTVALYNINYKEKSAEFGRLLIGDLECRGKGVGEKVTKILCDYGFDRLGLEKIVLEVFRSNIYAINVYKAVGFKDVYEENNYHKDIVKMEIIKSATS